jgi:cholestenol Delta-isomerase
MASAIFSNLTNPLITDHPYYPIEVEIASYLANEWSVPVLLAAFSGVCATVLLTAQIVVDRVHPNLRAVEKATIWWFILCMPLPPSFAPVRTRD